MGTLTTLLAAQPARWEDITGNYDLELGTATLNGSAVTPRDKKLRKRGFLKGLFKKVKEVVKDAGNFVKDSIDAVEKVAEKVGDGIEKAAEEIVDGIEKAAKEIADIFNLLGNFDLNAQIFLGITAGTEGKRSTIAVDVAAYVLHPHDILRQSVLIHNRPRPRYQIDCLNCFIRGGFNVAGTISIRWFMISDFTLGVSPKDFSAAMEIQAKLYTEAKTKPPKFKITHDILTFPIPGAGIMVPRILELGAIFAYEIGLEFWATSSITFETGVVASLPNGALAVADLLDLSNSRSIGFEGAIFKAKFQIDSGYGNLGISAVSKPRITLGFKIIG